MDKQASKSFPVFQLVRRVNELETVLRGLLREIEFHRVGLCDKLVDADCLECIYEAAEVAKKKIDR